MNKNPFIALGVGIATTLLTGGAQLAFAPRIHPHVAIVDVVLGVLMLLVLWPLPVHNHNDQHPPLVHTHDDRYSRTTHDHADAYAPTAHAHDHPHTHTELEHQLHDHLTNSADPAGPHTGRPDYNVAVVAPAVGGPRVI